MKPQIQQAGRSHAVQERHQHPQAKSIQIYRPRRWPAIAIFSGAAFIGLGGFGWLIWASSAFAEITNPINFITSGCLTLFLIVVAIAQFGLYWSQRDYMNAQWNVMERTWQAISNQEEHLSTQADAAKQAAGTAKQALIAGQRAFISVAFYKQDAFMDMDTGKITSYIFRPVWKNAGQTPTRNMINHVNLAVFKGAIPDNWHFPDVWFEGAEQKYVSLSIAPQATINGQHVPMSIEDVDDVVSQTKSALLYGWAEYDDVFPDTRKHVSRFAVPVVANGNPRDVKDIVFEYLFVPNYNCSDEECED